MSLILILLKDFPTTLLVFFWGVGVTVTFLLLARVLHAPPLALADGSLADSPLGDWAEIGIARKGMSPMNPGMGK
jgi:hypothetical protein